MEPRNIEDKFAIAVIDDLPVGHLPMGIMKIF